MNTILQKRIEEAARHYLLNEHKSPLNEILHQCDLKTEMQYHKDIESAYIAGATFALQNQWISVEEALPEENGWYLTLNTKSTSPNFADTCQWNAKGKYWYTELCGDVFLHERTHWMEIPSLKGGEE